jgi:hypothetical protein
MKKISFRETRDLIEIQKMTLEDYKQQVYDYLTTKLGRTTQQARNLMKGYENLFQGYLDDGWTVPMMATAVLYNY